MTPREPDRFEAKAREIMLHRSNMGRWTDIIAAALRAVEAEALERAAQVCRAKAKRMRDYAADTLDKESVPKAEACADQADDCADAIHNLRALASPAAAPAAEPQIRSAHGRSLDAVNAPFWRDRYNAAVKLAYEMEAILRECEKALDTEGYDSDPAPDSLIARVRALLAAEGLDPTPWEGKQAAPPSEPAAPAPDRCPFEEKDCLEARVLLHQCAKALRGVLAHAEWLDKHLGRLPNTDEENARTVLAKLAARTSPGAAGEGT